MKLQGNKTYRHHDNPKEKELHDKFIERYSGSVDMERIALLTDERSDPFNNLTQAEKQIMVSTIQWLGSPVGQSFLNDCGFELKE